MDVSYNKLFKLLMDSYTNLDRKYSDTLLA